MRGHGAAPWITLAAAAGVTLGLGMLAYARAGRGGALRVQSEPEGASVFVDGEFRGVTPIAVARLSSGAHAVRLEKSGYRAAFASADPSGGPRLGCVRLEPVPTGALDVTSTPSGADVYLEGEFRGVTPISLDGLRPGPRALRVEKTNFRPAGSRIVVPADGRTARKFELADRVLEYLIRAVEGEPDSVLANMELGQYLVARDQVERGLKHYRRGMMAGSEKYIRACASGVGADTVLGHRKRIERQMQKDLKLPEPTGSRVRILSASLRRELEEACPRAIISALSRARQLEAVGNTGAVEGAMSKLAGEYPQKAVLWSSLAACRMRAGHRDGALSALKRGFEVFRGETGAAIPLAVECLEEPILSEDKEAAGRVLELCATELALVRQAASGAESLPAARVEVRVLRKAGRGREALELIERVTPLEADAVGRARLELEKARVLASMGRVEEALKALERLAKEASLADVRNEARGEIASLRSR